MLQQRHCHRPPELLPPATHVSVVEAKAQLSRLLTLVRAGESFEITRHGRPAARLVACSPPAARTPGGLRGGCGADFDEALASVAPPRPRRRYEPGSGIAPWIAKPVEHAPRPFTAPRRQDHPGGLLLDTRPLLWWWTDYQRLSARARERIGDLDRAVCVSAASVLEIAVKHRHGRLRAFQPGWLNRLLVLIQRDGFTPLALDLADALAAGDLAGEPGDRFDHLLAAQAHQHRLALVTDDPVFAGFGVTTLW
jgi:prevent-host-death family protein